MDKKKYDRPIRHFCTMLVIWPVFIPVLILDLFTEIYHHIGFRLCNIPLVERSKYIRIDRHKLEYLTIWDKFGCMYCGYVNGFLGYAVQIAARTEMYWCGIMHEKKQGFIQPNHHNAFMAYGDKHAYEEIKKRK